MRSFPKLWTVCDTVRDEYTGCWGDVIVWCLSAVYTMVACVLILEVMFVLVLGGELIKN